MLRGHPCLCNHSCSSVPLPMWERTASQSFTCACQAEAVGLAAGWEDVGSPSGTAAGGGASPGHQLSAGLSLSHSPITQSCGAFWSLTVLIQDTEGYSNKALRPLTFWATTEKLGCGRQGYLSEIARSWEEAVLAVGFSSPAEWRKTEVVDFLICKTFLSWISCVKMFICSPAPTAVPVLLQALCTQVWRSFCTSQNISVKGQ